MNLFNMAKDLKGMEKMMKPALEKFMKDSGFVKKEELIKLENRIDVKNLLSENLKSFQIETLNLYSFKAKKKKINKNFNGYQEFFLYIQIKQVTTKICHINIFKTNILIVKFH